MRNLKVESYDLSHRNIGTRAGKTASQATLGELTLRRRGGARLYASLQQGAGNLRTEIPVDKRKLNLSHQEI